MTPSSDQYGVPCWEGDHAGWNQLPIIVTEVFQFLSIEIEECRDSALTKALTANFVELLMEVIVKGSLRRNAKSAGAAYNRGIPVNLIRGLIATHSISLMKT